MTFSGPVLHWRGPAPHFFVPVPAEHVPAMRDAARLVTHGWGMVPATVGVGDLEYDTALFPRDGGYLVPLRAKVRAAQGLGEGDEVTLRLSIRSGKARGKVRPVSPSGPHLLDPTVPRRNSMNLLQESFRRNARVNTALLEALSPADLAFSDGSGGMTVGQHLAHLARFRVGWLSSLSPDFAGGVPHTALENGGLQCDAETPNQLGEALRGGDAQAMKAVEHARRENKPFADPWGEGSYASDPAHFLGHIVAHDSHHRGQVMGLLRRSGWDAARLEALEAAMWGPWRE